MGSFTQFTTVKSGEISGSASAKQLPDIPCKMVKFIGQSDNTGGVYLGGSSSVTVPDGTQDATSGLHIDTSVDSGWIPVDNLNRFWIICDNAGDDLTYLALA